MQSRLWNSLVFCGGLLCSSPAWAIPPTDVSNQETHTNGGEAHHHSENTRHSASLSTISLYDKVKLEFSPTQPAPDTPVSKQARDLQQISPPSTFYLTERFSEPTFSKADPELGELEVSEPQQPSPESNENPPEEPQQPTNPPEEQPAPSDPDLGELQVEDSEQSGDELGDIIIDELPTPAPPRPRPKRAKVVYLQGRLDYFRTSNVFSGIDPIDDALFRSGLSLLATPRLGPRTFLIAGVDGNIVHYANEVRINYDELRLRAGVFHQLSPRMYGEIGWTNQQLFFGGDNLGETFSGQRFLNDHAIRLELSRQDPLSKKLMLTTFYQLRLSFAEPENRSRLINSFFASLSYTFFPALQAGLDYQFALADFTQEDRQDRYHQVLLRVTYKLSNQTRLTAFGGYSFGGSSVSTIDFDGGIFGISLNVNLPLF
jgi:hypothetical protein